MKIHAHADPRFARNEMNKILLILLLITLPAFAQWTEPVLLPSPINVDPPGEYYYSTISADGQILCLTIDTDNAHGGYGDDDVWFSIRSSGSSWSRPVNAGPNVNNATRNLSPSITNDRQKLYFVSWTGSTYKMFVSSRTGPGWSDWSTPQEVPHPVNRGRVFTGQILWDDSTLCFTDTGQPGPLFGGDAMYTSRLQPDGTWTEPHLLGFHLNRLNNSYHPCLTDSGRTLVYGQYGGPHLEDDIFYTFRNDTGFGLAMRCDSTVNGAFWDSDPSCPADGSLLYFESRRPSVIDTNGGAHLYVAHRVPASVPRQTPYTRSVEQRLQIIPSFGSQNTIFQITVPQPFRGQSLYIVNILGQRVTTVQPMDKLQTIFQWNTSDYGIPILPNGVYFITTSNGRDQIAGKFIIVQ
jgi:hypothetical protein